jgi:hypothetical protein
MNSTGNSGGDIGRIIAQAEGEISQQLLSRSGEGGLFSTGYLSETPFYELLRTDEIPHYLFASVKKPPDIGGQPQRESLDSYRAITAATSDRILYAVGGSDGDITGEIKYSDIDQVEIVDAGSILRSDPALIIESTDQGYRFYGANVADQDALLNFIREQVANAHMSKISEQINTAKEKLCDGNLPDTANEIDTAQECLHRAKKWHRRAGYKIEVDDTLSDHKEEIDSLTKRLSASRTVRSALEDAEEVIERGDVAFKSGSINEASNKYDEARGYLDNTGKTIAIELSNIPVQRELRRVRSELRLRGLATTPTEAHQKLYECLETVREAEGAGEEAKNPQQAKNSFGTALEGVEEYFDNLRSADIGFAETASRGHCDSCGRPVGVYIDIELGGTRASVCAPCSEFDGGRLLTEDETEEYVERLERKRSLAELQRVGEELGHIPSRQEFNRYSSLPVAELESHCGSFNQALSISSLEVPSGRPIRGPLDEPPDASGDIPSHTDLLRELHWLVERKGKSAAQERFGAIGSFDVEHYELQFESLDDAFDRLFEHQYPDIKGSEYAPRRVLVDELSRFGEFLQRAPTLIELLYYSSVSLGKFAEKFGSLADIHSAAGFEYDSDDPPSNEELLTDIQRVGKEFDRPPTLSEYANRGQYDYTSALRRFDGWIATLNTAGYTLLTTVPSLRYIRTEETDRVRFESTLRVETGFGKRKLLLDDLYRLQHQFGDELSAQLVGKCSRYPVTAYQSVFNTVDAAISTIGATPTHSDVDVQRLDQSLQQSLNEVGDRLGREPTQEEVDALGEYVSITFLARFGSWNAALETCLNLSDLAQHEAETPNALLWELDYVAETIGYIPRPGRLLSEGQYSESTYLDTFDSWQALYKAAGRGQEHGKRRKAVDTSEVSGIAQSNSGHKSDQNQSQDENVGADKTTDDSKADSGSQKETSAEPDNGSQADKSRQAMIETLQDLYNELGRIPLANDIRDRTKYSQYNFTSEFGSLDDALAQAGYDKRESLLEELKRVTAELGHPPSTTEFAEYAEFSSGLYTQYFVSWEDTLEAAGVNKNSTDDTVSQENPNTSTTVSTSSESEDCDSENENVQDRPSDEQLLDELRTLDAQLETVPRWGDMNEQGSYNSQTYLNRFGSWDAALEEAGVDKSGQLLGELERLAGEVGRLPSTGDMNEQGKYSASMYARFFGSWSNAVKKLDSEAATPTQQNDAPPKQSEAPERKELISELNRLANETDGLTKAGDMRESGAYTLKQYTEEFGSWDEALDEAGIDRRAQLIREVKKVWQRLGRRPSTVEMNEYGRVSATTVTEYFDTWWSACNLADPSTNSTDKDESPQQNDSDKSSSKDELSEENLSRLSDIVRLEPTKNAELKKEWQLESGREVHQYLKSRLSEYYYRDEESYIRATDDGEALIGESEGGVSNSGKSGDDITGGSSSKGKSARITSYSSTEESYSRNELISEIKKVRRVVHQRPTVGDFKTNSDVPISEVEEQFGSWKSAVAAALPERSPSVGNKDKKKKTNGYTQEEILDEIRRVTVKVGWTPSSSDIEDYGDVSIATIRNHFDTWTEARTAAGVDEMTTDRLAELKKSYNEVSNRELLQAIKQLHNQTGDSMTPADIVSFTEYNEEAYAAAFGSVIEAMREAGLDV